MQLPPHQRHGLRPAPAGGDRRHAVVIGTGFGGLAAAIRLGARGYRVTMLERRNQPGGRAGVFRQDGFTFDAGPTIITAPFLLEELWQMCGRTLADDIDLRPMDPFYRIRFDDGATFSYNGDSAEMLAQIRQWAPGDVEGYGRFMQASETLCRIGFEELGHVEFGRITDMLRIAPDLVRQRAHLSVYGLVSRFFRDERLRTIFSFHPLLIGGNPFTATAVYGLIAALERRWGVHFVMGGTGALVQGMVRLVEGQGGSIVLGAEVAEITVQQRRATGVRLASGECIAADVVVSNADSAFTYGTLLPAEHRRRWTDRKLARSRYSMGLFVWYFGTKRQYADVAHHTIMLGPRYRGLLDDIFRRKHLADDFSLYLHRPTATDPSLAPPGHDTFYVLAPVPNLQAGIDWRTAAEPYCQRIERHLAATLLPGLADSIVTSRMMTPQDFADDLLSCHGAGFGLEPTLLQSAWFRPHNRSEEIDRLYLVGAGTHPGAGVPGVISSARVLDRVVPDVDALA